MGAFFAAHNWSQHLKSSPIGQFPDAIDLMVRGLRSGRVTAVARAIHIGRTTHVWDIRLCSDEGKASCVSRLTMAVVPLGQTPPAR